MATGAVAPDATVPVPVPDTDSSLGTGTGEDAKICCNLRLGCSTFRGLNLRKRHEREDTTTTDWTVCSYILPYQ